MEIEEEIRKIIMKTLLFDHAEDERELRCYEDIKESDIERCIFNVEKHFGIMLDEVYPSDFILVGDIIKSAKWELS